MLMPASQGDIFQTPSWFSLICTTTYGSGNARCAASTHLPACSWICFPRSKSCAAERQTGEKPWQTSFFPALSLLHPPEPWQAPFPLWTEGIPGRGRRLGRDGRWRSEEGDGRALGSVPGAGHAPRAAPAHGPLRSHISLGECLFFSCHLASDSCEEWNELRA